MKVMNLMRLGFVAVMGGALVSGCTAEVGGELSILRVPTPDESCEVSPDEEASLANGVFDPVVNASSQDGARIGFLVKNGLRSSENAAEVNDSGEAIGPTAPNNVLMSGFNICYYLADDPNYQALIADGVDSLREDCEEGSVAIKEFTSSSGSLITQSDATSDSGSLVYASLLGRNVLEEFFGRSFDLQALSALGFANNNSAQFANCAGRDVNLDGEFDATCSDPSLSWSAGNYLPWVTAEVASGNSGNDAWGTYPFKCVGSDCTQVPDLATVQGLGFGTMTDYFAETYRSFQEFLLPTAQTTVIVYLQAVGETVTGVPVKSSYFLFPVDLCVGCVLDDAYAACPQGITQTVCSYGSCIVGDPTAGSVTVEECTAPAQDFTGCAGDPDSVCGPLVSAAVGEVPEIVTCGGGYHFSNLVAFTCQTRSCPQ
jgi:hypothetical protein